MWKHDGDRGRVVALERNHALYFWLFIFSYLSMLVLTFHFLIWFVEFCALPFFVLFCSVYVFHYWSGVQFICDSKTIVMKIGERRVTCGWQSREGPLEVLQIKKNWIWAKDSTVWVKPKVPLDHPSVGRDHHNFTVCPLFWMQFRFIFVLSCSSNQCSKHTLMC